MNQKMTQACRPEKNEDFFRGSNFLGLKNYTHFNKLRIIIFEITIMGIIIFAGIKSYAGWDIDRKAWLFIGSPELNCWDKNPDVKGKSKIHSDILVEGKLLDIKVNYSVIHNTGPGGTAASSVTMKYEVKKAHLPTGPIYLKPCWNCFAITKLPVKIRHKPKGPWGYAGNTIGAKGKMWFKEEGIETVIFELTSFYRKCPLESGIYGIDTWIPGYIVDPDTPKIQDFLPRPHRWRRSLKFIKQMTILIANLTKYKIKTEFKTTGKANSPFRVKITLEDADGKTYPVPNALLRVLFPDKDGIVKEKTLIPEFTDDPVTQFFCIPTGWYKTVCPVNIREAKIKICICMGLPDGEKKQIMVEKTYVLPGK